VKKNVAFQVVRGRVTRIECLDGNVFSRGVHTFERNSEKDWDRFGLEMWGFFHLKIGGPEITAALVDAAGWRIQKTSGFPLFKTSKDVEVIHRNGIMVVDLGGKQGVKAVLR